MVVGRHRGRRRAAQRLSPDAGDGLEVLEITQPDYGKRWLLAEGAPELLFTENETNTERLYRQTESSSLRKGRFPQLRCGRKSRGGEPRTLGNKSGRSLHFRDRCRELAPQSACASPIRILRIIPAESRIRPADSVFGAGFEKMFAARIQEADEFYALQTSKGMTADAVRIQRQAFAGLLWNQAVLSLRRKRWLAGDPTPARPAARTQLGRNHEWTHLYNADVISMPDKWEYPWYAAWDLAFHCVPMALIDPDFAKEQLMLLLREWYMHPNGQIPAYEWTFSDVNPPVHAWAAWRVYQIEERIRGTGDRDFLERVFHKLLLNFTWWVNRKDPDGMNVFEGGFLGLDNIGVFDRSLPLPTADRTSSNPMAPVGWPCICLNMLAIAMELAHEDSAYEDVASKFFEHFVYIAEAMNAMGEGRSGCGTRPTVFITTRSIAKGAGQVPLKVRSMVGLIPLFAVETFEPEDIAWLAGFPAQSMAWFLDHHPEVPEHMDLSQKTEKGTRMLHFHRQSRESSSAC